MILNFPGGVRPQNRTLFGNHEIKEYDSCSVICHRAQSDASVSVSAGTSVKRGTPLGVSDGTPVYSSVAGVFRGLLEIEGGNYFVVMGNGKIEEETPFSPETRAITQLSFDDVAESAKKLAIYDSRSGMPLWKLLEKTGGECRRVVIDCTETDPLSAINYRLCVEHAKEIVGGAKILLHSVGALKCVFAAEYNRGDAFKALSEFAFDERLFAMAPMEEKYPYGDRALMYALYVKTLAEGETALDHGVLIVSAESALALYRSMASGMPQLDRYLTVCGEGIENGNNIRVPRGITVHDIVAACGGVKDGYRLIENSLLSGDSAKGVLGESTQTLIAARPIEKKRVQCISCGNCASVCPVKLFPSEILAGDRKTLARYCVFCGACEYICPSGIPLLTLIKNKINEPEEDR